MTDIRIKTILVLVLAALVAAPAKADQRAPLRLVYDAPAEDWEQQGLPIGNGAMGAMIMGGVREDRIQFNEKTLWTGGPGAQGGYDYGLPKTSIAKEVRAVARDILDQGPMSPEEAARRLGRPMLGYGAYQSFGELVVTSADGDVKAYDRDLDIESAVARVRFERDGAGHERAYIASFPDKAIVIRYEAAAPGALSFRAALAIPDNRSAKIETVGHRLLATGALNDNGLKWAAAFIVLAEGGSVAPSGDGVAVENADAATIILTAGTDYALDHPRYRGGDPAPGVIARAEKAAKRGWPGLLERHVMDHEKLFGRFSLDIGQKPPAKTTDALLAAYPALEEASARWLEALYIQYGRYLLIASSREGSLPANLQGVWNNSETPPWHADYHVNINLQMNYWPANPLNLGETAAPLFDFIDNLAEAGRESARKIAGAPGWTVFLNTNIWGFTGLIDWPTAFWQPEGAAWLCRLYYDHYLYTGDTDFLRTRAYPAMKAAARYWLDQLVDDPRDGRLIVAPSFSPEHGPFTAGAAMSQQIVDEHFRNTAEAARLLGENDFAREIETAHSRLDRGRAIGSWGQLQEWKEDLDDPENDHRHVSHLYALHPGAGIDAIEDEALIEAARVSLNARGDGGTGWSKAWKVNLWARLLDGPRAHKMLEEQLKYSTLSNLLDTHPPFQIDGNFGASAGVAEMLMQSHGDVIRILPALPDDWRDGEVRGLRARGNVELDITWRDGVVENIALRPGRSAAYTVYSELFDGQFTVIDMNSDAPVAMSGEGRRRTMSLDAGGRYEIRRGSD